MKKRAFTLLELTFVILILGIVSSIAASVLSKIYENHLIQRSIHQLSVNTELAAEQIANRLQFSIPMLVVARNPNDWSKTRELWKAINTTADENKTVLEWIGYDNDSFSADTTPGWSGFADLDSARANGSPDGHSIRTPGSDLSLANTIMQNLSHNDVGTTAGDGKDRPILLFSGDIQFTVAGGGIGDAFSRASCLGLGTNINDINCSIPITTSHFANAHDRINVNATPINMGEFYKLAWSAYALVPSAKRADGTFDLSLAYSYQPWFREKYNSNAAKKNMLIRNVTSFKFMERGNTLRFKLCARSYISGLTDFVTACKEKVISR